jgi:hypothetical protein
VSDPLTEGVALLKRSQCPLGWPSPSGRACGIKVLGGIAIRILSKHRILSDFLFFFFLFFLVTAKMG